MAAGSSDLKAGPDGALWARTDANSFGRLEGDTWSEVVRTDFYQPWAIGADGSLWTGDWPFGIRTPRRRGLDGACHRPGRPATGGLLG